MKCKLCASPRIRSKSAWAPPLVLRRYCCHVIDGTCGRYLDTTDEDSLVASAKQLCEDLQAVSPAGTTTLLNIGPCVSVAAARALPRILVECEPLFASLRVGCRQGVPSSDMLRAAATAVLRLSRESPGGEACFKFAATFNCAPGIPFFPAGAAALCCVHPFVHVRSPCGWHMRVCGEGYHEGQRSFALGLENSGLVYEAFRGCQEGDLGAAATALESVMNKALVKVDAACQELASEHCMQVRWRPRPSLLTRCADTTPREQYDGIDTSVAPATDAPLERTLVAAYECLVGAGRFGGAGTLAVSSIITRVLKALSVKVLPRRVATFQFVCAPLTSTCLHCRPVGTVA